MRIATQTESALICKGSTRPHSLSLNSGVWASQRTPSSDGRALKDTHRTGRHFVQQTLPCSLLATVKRDIGRQSPVSLMSSDFSRCLPPVSSGL
ncbi:hypothetical protein TNCV_336581 [Trichonephila clavipes]|nr:hypothetical protein TNCV_336581 [Trichonephila clavipes]